jgi:mono/diheme cytochrome c family protein
MRQRWFQWSARAIARWAFIVAGTAFSATVVNITLQAAQDTDTPPTSLEAALPANATGEQIFRQTCATCHAVDGAGSPQAVLGFQIPLPNGHTLPDFIDCPTNTVEPLGDWVAVATRGGPIRGLDRHMPAFGDALSPEQIEKVIRYLWSFCANPKWPRGDLNFPRAFFTEKAFPESETVWTTGVTAKGSKRVGNDLTYEHRVGVRGQYEVTIPIDFQQGEAGGSWNRGLGDLELAYRQTLFASVTSGSIFAAGGAITLPTGKEDRGLGNGFTIYEPFAMFDQAIGASSFVQVHAGYEVASDHDKGDNEAYFRTAFGYTVAQDKGFGRAWTPMAEFLVARPDNGSAEYDVVPQMQVSLSKLQHILVSVGVRVPLNEREERKPELLTYFLWDWFDGGLFEFWK